MNNIIQPAVDFFRRSGFYLREYFFPSGCGLCGGVLTDMDESWLGLCGKCMKMIELPGVYNYNLERCSVCGRPLVSELGRCLSCRSKDETGDVFAYNRLSVVFPYTGTFRALLQAYKFNKSVALGNFFARRIRGAVQDFGSDAAGAVLVPVPPRHGKIRETGWDQIEHLASVLEMGQSHYGIEKAAVYRCLRRLPSGVQKELNREDRRRNLQDRIKLIRSAPKTAVLFDDVITTGSTMNACALALKAGGTERVFGVCLFYD